MGNAVSRGGRPVRVALPRNADLGDISLVAAWRHPRRTRRKRATSWRSSTGRSVGKGNLDRNRESESKEMSTAARPGTTRRCRALLELPPPYYLNVEGGEGGEGWEIAKKSSEKRMKEMTMLGQRMLKGIVVSWHRSYV